MEAEPARTVGKTPTIAFVLDYLREFPGAEYPLVKKAALSHWLPAPATIVYGNALRVLEMEAGRAAELVVAEMQQVVDERDRLREAVKQIAGALKTLPDRDLPTCISLGKFSHPPGERHS